MEENRDLQCDRAGKTIPGIYNVMEQGRLYLEARNCPVELTHLSGRSKQNTTASFMRSDPSEMKLYKSTKVLAEEEGECDWP